MNTTTTTIDDDAKRERMQRILARAAERRLPVSTAARWFTDEAADEADRIATGSPPTTHPRGWGET